MSEWKEYKLGDIAEITSSKRIFYSEYVENGVPFYRSKEIIDLFNRRDIQTELFITEKRFKEIEEKFGVPLEDDILLTSVGSLGVPYKVKRKDKFYFKDGNLTWFRNLDKSKVIPDFLFTWISSNVGKQKLDEVSIGSTQAALTISGLKTIEILLPDLKTQKSIASILSSLDDKIDLLHRQNATLEKMAETLFRQWFVEEAKEEWEIKQLKEITDIAIGRTPPRKESRWFSTNSQDIKWISIKDLGDDGVFISNTSEYLTKEAVETFNIPVIPKDTVVLSFKMTVGRVAITFEEMLSNEAIAHFKFNNKTPFSKEYLYIFLKTYKYETLGSTSSIVTAINSAMIKEMEILIPDEFTMNAFKNETEPLFNKIKTNQTQIRTLTALRDTLLPKLMSGEVTTN